MNMELEFERETMISWETMAELTLSQEETLESIVPDACPDILRIVDVCGQSVLSGKQAREGAAVVSGMVRAVILYQPEGTVGLHRMEVGLPFSCQAEVPGLTERGKVFASPRLRCAEARALNPRKVLLRVDLVVDVTACQLVEQSVCQGVLADGENAICQRQFQGETYQLCCVEEKPFTFTENIRLQTNQGESPQILAIWVQPTCTESKLIGAKLIFKGTVEVRMLLQEPGGIVTASREALPFSQIMEVVGAGEESDCQVQVELSDLQWETGMGDEREVEITLELLTQARVRSRRPVKLLQDLYSTAWQTETEYAEQYICRLEEQSVRPQAVRELMETEEPVRSVVDGRLSLGQLTQNREGDQVNLTAEAWLTALYLDEKDQIQCIRRMVPVTCRLDCPKGNKCSCICACPGEVFLSPGVGGVEVRFTLEFHCLMVSQRTVPSVRTACLGAERAENEGPRPSVVLRMAAPGEAVWDIAKSYGTTSQQILQANGLEDGELPTGKMLLIPRAR